MSELKTPKIALLVGAGFSLPAGMPKTSELTTAIVRGVDLNGTRISKHSDCTFGFWPQMTDKKSKERAEPAIQCVKAIEHITRRYFDRFYERSGTYEELYNVARFSCDALSGEYPNPVAESFLRELLVLIRSEYDLDSIRDRISFSNFLKFDVCAYFKDAVSAMLAKHNSEPSNSQQSFIQTLCADHDVSRDLLIATLNHDTLIEQCLERLGVAYCDGFETKAEKEYVRFWDPDRFGSRSDSLTLLKLHGSLDWWYIKEFPDSKVNMCIPRSKKNFHFMRSADESVDWADYRPSVLLGTTTKANEYQVPIFNELQCQFHVRMQKVDRLITVGYSFGDRFINNQIVGWMFPESKDRSICVVSPTATQDLQRNFRVHEKWESCGRLEKLEVKVEDLDSSGYGKLLGTRK